MRSAMESLLVPTPPSLSLALMQEELVANLHIPSDKVSTWLSAQVLTHPTCQTCGDLMALTCEEMRTAFQKAELTSSEVATVQVCLGTVGAPYQWRANVNVTKVNELDVKPKKKKGGPQSEKSEVLVIRRPEMVDGQYFPPAQFDPHRPGAITRDEKVLRKLIVQEVCTSRVLHVRAPCDEHSQPRPCYHPCRLRRCAETCTRRMLRGGSSSAQFKPIVAPHSPPSSTFPKEKSPTSTTGSAATGSSTRGAPSVTWRGHAGILPHGVSQEWPTIRVSARRARIVSSSPPSCR